MILTKEEKQQLFATYGVNPVGTDTGSATAQIALFSSRITYLTKHIKQNPKDKAARLGLIELVGRRKRQLNYLQKNKLATYRDIIEKLAIRK